MLFKDLIRKQLFILPQTVNTNYSEHLEKIFEEYLTLINNVTDFDKIKGISKTVTIDALIKRQKEFTTGLLKVIDTYFDGKPYEAFKILSETIQNRIKVNRKMIRINTYEKGECFYRMRLKTDHFQYKKKEMFHIPFELRENVKTQRFSIPGYPSLYVGRTIYVCWEELNRPDLSTFQVSKIENSKPLKYLDLTPPSQKKGVYNMEMYGYIMIWPLIAACSIKVKSQEAVFKPEYIIPQLLLQWVRTTNDVDGIKYNTTHVDHKKINIEGEYGNLVFPVKSNLKSGLCKELLNCFEITEPISWHLLQMLEGGNSGFIYLEKEFDYLDEKLPEFLILNGNSYKYSNSVLGAMEHFLNKKSSAYI